MGRIKILFLYRKQWISISEAPDFESKNQYNVEIMVSDDGINFSSPHPLTVNISNVNEMPVFTDNGLPIINDPFLETDLKVCPSGHFENYKGVVYDPNCTDPDNDNLFFTLRLLSDKDFPHSDSTTYQTFLRLMKVPAAYLFPMQLIMKQPSITIQI